MHDLKWNYTEWYCQKCGKQTVVELPGVDEDNAGWQHLCFSCGFGFMSPGEDYTDLRSNEKTAVMVAVQQSTRPTGMCPKHHKPMLDPENEFFSCGCVNDI